MRRTSTVIGLTLMLIMLAMAFGPIASAKTTVTLWAHFYEPRIEKLRDQIERFEAENPDITIKLETFPYQEFWDKLMPSMVTGTGPDLIHSHGSWTTTFVQSNLWEPVPANVFSKEEIEELWLPGPRQAFERDGIYYGLPYAANAYGLYYNKGLFRDAGLDPDAPPVTWDEMVEMGKKMTRYDNTGAVIQAGFGAKVDKDHMETDFVSFFMQLGGTPIREDNTVGFDSDEGRQALQFYDDLLFKHKLADPQFPPRYDAFIQGKVGMMLGVGSFAADVRKRGPEIDFGVSVVPGPEVGKHETMDGGGWGWSVNTRSKPAAKEAAWKFFKFLNSREEHLFMYGIEGMAVHRDVDGSPELNQILAEDAVAAGLQSTIRYNRFIGDTVNFMEFCTAIDKWMQSVFFERMSVDQAISRMTQDLNRVLTQKQ